MDRVYLQWNIANWLTVVLMAALGYSLFALVAQLYHNRKGA